MGVVAVVVVFLLLLLLPSLLLLLLVLLLLLSLVLLLLLLLLLMLLLLFLLLLFYASVVRWCYRYVLLATPCYSLGAELSVSLRRGADAPKRFVGRGDGNCEQCLFRVDAIPLQSKSFP